MGIQSSLRRVLLICTAALAVSFAGTYVSSPIRIPAAEFSKIIRDFSEEGGYFFSDNLISNEDGYLSILKKMRDLRVSGGAYIGVGPEQNFTYIAKSRPAIAFLIDVRRQAMIQHLMYKALFHLSSNRAEFLSRLLARPLTGKAAPGPDAALGRMIEYFSSAPPDYSFCASNLAEIEKVIQSEFKCTLSQEDLDSLAYISRSFCAEGIDISFKFRSRRGGFAMPSMRELLQQLDPDGNAGNFLASTEDYRFIRSLHENNRIIPVVGDFAGPKTLKAIARYLKDHSYTVSIFYTSNVEMYLFQNESFGNFVENVKLLPVSSKSLFIRSANNRWGRFSPGTRMSTMLQYISVFLKDNQEGLYTDYWTLVGMHHIPLSPK
jgi:hypothetical protein